MLNVNPHALVVAGENSFLRLRDNSGATASHWVSHWRVVWSPVGSGHALFIDSPLVLGIRILTDVPELAGFLQREIEPVLYPPFANVVTPAVHARFEREGVPPMPCCELIHSENLRLELRWSDFMEPFSFHAEPGFRGGPLGIHTTFFPARSAELLVNGERASGSPWPDTRGDQPCTSACLAWCETWYRPRGAT